MKGFLSFAAAVAILASMPVAVFAQGGGEVPEPATLALLGGGLVAAGWVARRRKG